MGINVLYQFSRVLNRWKRYYWKKCFEGYLGGIKTENLSIVGKMYLRNPNVHIGKNVTLYPGVMLYGEGEIYIGDNTYLCNNTMVYSEKGYEVYIGSNCMIAPMCYITNTDHNIKLSPQNKTMNTMGVICKNTYIDDDVWLAEGVTILKGTHIRRGCLIGAKALVNCDTEENGVYVGIPAKCLKFRKE